MKNLKKKIPKFKNESEEIKFWSEHDSTEYIDYNKGKEKILSNLKPTSHLISIRIPDYMLNRLKMLAHKKDVPYQSLLKVYLSEKIEEEVYK